MAQYLLEVWYLARASGVWAVFIPVLGLFIESAKSVRSLGSRGLSLGPTPCNLSLMSFEYSTVQYSMGTRV